VSSQRASEGWRGDTEAENGRLGSPGAEKTPRWRERSKEARVGDRRAEATAPLSVKIWGRQLRVKTTKRENCLAVSTGRDPADLESVK
jgi:hypothetical protein